MLNVNVVVYTPDGYQHSFKEISMIAENMEGRLILQRANHTIAVFNKEQWNFWKEDS